MSDTQWDLGALYASATDPAWAADLARAAASAEQFRSDFRGKVAGADGDFLAAALVRYEALQRAILQPYAYAQLLFAADSRVPAHGALLARARETYATVSERTLFFELEVLQIPAERFTALLQEPAIAPYGHFLERLRVAAPYTLSEEVEQVLKRKDLSGREGFVQLFDELSASLVFPFQMPGEEGVREVTGEELLGLLYHPEGGIREAAFATFLDGHAQQKLVLNACFNNILLDHGREAELRGYPDLMTPTLLANETEPEVVARLSEVTAANYGLARDYFDLKRQLLGLDRLKNSDLYAPLSRQSRTIPFAEARELVLGAFARFSPEMAEVAGRFFTEQRIDALPRPGKGGGAFCMGVAPGTPAYVLLNYTGRPRDVATLAHELGHGVHYALAAKQNLFHYHAPLPFAETASVFGEMLLTRHLLERDGDRDTRIALLCAQLEDIIATTFRQEVLTRFELAAHRRRGEGQLSSEDLCTLWWEENAKLFGDSVEMIPSYRWGWSYISHFIHARFYCYSYVFGELLVLALYRRYQEEGAAFVPRYLDLLRAGGSAPPAELLRPFGIDLAGPGFWQQGYDLVAELLAELKGLVAGS
ncbi:M3 family oligoendopeptidase [Desulfuromonas carbonis]|uniref:M3 family oligoendopeptidase n=1 Tax=Desulfuromonas sp. DDH964 TaxID=1823759 RepID=UPI00078D8A23|nr:M3 family oligoendopeptidase [Desulfuromonas sp. DDH964]AMV73900.1 oligoendopeptidase F [Desulfuromonas sp. DDH964]